MTDMRAAKHALETLSVSHEVCLDTVASAINKAVHIAVEHCGKTNLFIHRIRVDRYWQDINLVGLTNRLNQDNAEKYKK